jgi:cell division protein FtsZ
MNAPQPQRTAPTPQSRPAEARAPEQAPPMVDYIDEQPLPPRQIPAHLQQPIRPMSQARPAPRAAEPRPAQARHSLFSEQAPTPAPAPRKSLFGIVTGAIRGHAAEVPAEPAPRMEPQGGEFTQEAPRAQVRPAATDDIGLEIPAFLRRQS